jgi:hypothetical protein
LTAAPARALLGHWVMGLVRLGAGWLVVARPLALLVTEPSPIAAGVALHVRLVLAAALGVGLTTFAWPRSCQYGLALLLAALAAFEALRHHLGMPPTPRVLTAIAILAVLAAGEWLTRRVEGRR